MLKSVLNNIKNSHKQLSFLSKFHSATRFKNHNILYSNKFQFAQQVKQNSSKFKFSQMTQKQYELCKPGLAASFVQVQPFITLNLNLNQTFDLIDFLKPLALKSQVSNVVRNKQTDQILGCTLIFDAFDQKSMDYTKLDMKVWEPLLQLLDQVSHDFLQKNGAFKTPRLYAHSFMTGIFPQHKNQRVGRQLFMYQLRSCKEKGYKYIVRQTTNHIARRVLLQRLTGYFQQKKFIKYSDFVYKGERVMKDTPHGASLIVSDLSLVK